MKKMKIIDTMSKSFNKVGFKLKKHSPEIMIAAGIVGTVASAVLACKATLKVHDVLDNSKNTIDDIHEATVNGKTKAGKDYSVEDSKKDLTTVYAQTALKLVKLYAPSVVLGTLSIASIVTSNNILRKRNIALTAAYATIDKSFKDYRGRVVERFGKEVDRQLKYNLKEKEVTETVVNEKGEEQTVTKKVTVVDPTFVSGYARFFEEYTRDEEGNVIKNHYWENNNEYNVMFLKAQERYANDLLRAKKRLFLNEVYDMLGLPRSKAGQIVGWRYDEECPTGDNFVDFGITATSDRYSDFVYGNDNGILLDFNVDGNIWEDM